MTDAAGSLHDEGTSALRRPGAGEYHAFYAEYIARVAGDEILAVLDAQQSTIVNLGRLGDGQAEHAYGPDKWTIKEVVGHLADAERVFAYRSLRFARGDTTDLPGFESGGYVPAGKFGSRAVRNIADELAAVRSASLALFRSLDASSAERTGTANGSPCTVRALAWIIAGHFAHHVALLRERYGVEV